MISFIVPTRDHARTIVQAVERINSYSWPLPHEVIVADEGSQDDTLEILEQRGLLGSTVRVESVPRGAGRGSAIRSASKTARGDYLAWFSADLTYTAEDLAGMIEYLVDDRADAVVGSRYLGPGGSITRYWRARGHRFVTLLSNALTDMNLTDATSGCWVIRKATWDRMNLRSRGVELDMEVIAALSRMKARVWEVPVGHDARWREYRAIGRAVFPRLMAVLGSRLRSDLLIPELVQSA
ncbi:MAG TPA: glycosyltransferase family 2 protein [Gemmatimonadales bacterium]|nr:glycosyltransferase family 2 protein [Gemmatimonadales bacterium]